MPKIDYSKVESVNVNHGFEVTYKSGTKRMYQVDDINAEIRQALDAGLSVYGELPEGFVPKDQVIKFDQNLEATVVIQNATDDPATVLANLVGLTPAQAELLPGTNRLNFWRNGQLWIQIQHGASSVKVPCTKAPTDEEIKALLFDEWRWSKLDENRLYFRPSKEARVIL